MNKKLISFLTLMFMLFSVCISNAEDELSIDSAGQIADVIITSDAYDEDVKSDSQIAQNNVGEDAVTSHENEVKQVLESVKEQAVATALDLSKYAYTKAKIATLLEPDVSAENLSTTAQRQFAEFLDNLFERCISVVDETSTDVTISGSRLKYTTVYQTWRPNLSVPYSERQFQIDVYERCIILENLYGYDFDDIIFPVTDGKYVADYISEITENGLSGFKSKKNSDTNISISELDKKIDELSFDFVVPASFKGEFTDVVADVGETINASFEHYTEANSRDYYFLTLKGKNKSITLWNVVYNTTLGGNGHNPSSNLPIEFLLEYCVENGVTTTNNNKGDFDDRVVLQIIFSGNEVKSLKIAYQKPDISVQYEVISKNPLIRSEVTTKTYAPKEKAIAQGVNAYNITYTVHEDDDYSLSESFKDVDKESEIEKLKAENDKYGETIEQDPERWSTYIKGPRNDGKIYDYRINFLAEIDIKYKGEAVPGWYKALGDNVTATVLGYTLTLDGLERSNQTMIRFKGDKDYIWFNGGNMLDNRTDSAKKIKAISYYSLISFDGTTLVRNTLDYDTITAVMRFSNDDKKKFESITLELGTMNVDADFDEIKLIGGRMLYEEIY